MRRPLSSEFTILLKFIFPTIWIPGFGLVALSTFWGGWRMNGGKSLPPEMMKWYFLVMWLLGSSLIWFTVMRLKRVRVDDQTLYVSNYFKEIQVPLAHVIEVAEYTWINPQMVTVTLSQPTPFGRRIGFMPTERIFERWRSTPNPVIKELQTLAAEAGSPIAQPPAP